MKKVTILIILILTSLLQHCKCQNANKFKETGQTYYVTKKDSILIERFLLHNKNVIFSLLYNKSKKETYTKKGIKLCDTLQDLTYYHFYDFDLHITGDPNLDKLLREWLNKEEYYMVVYDPPEKPDGSLDLARALEFYNSEDLDFYIDFLRQDYYKGFFEIDYKSNPPKDATVPYVTKKDNK